MITSNVPIIGQPKITDFNLTLLVECPCGKPLLISGKLGAMSTMCECRRVYRLGPFESVPEDASKLNIALGVGTVPLG